MNLKKSENPARQMTWNNKSLTVCSRKELIQCIFHLVRQVTVAEAKFKAYNGEGKNVQSVPEKEN